MKNLDRLFFGFLITLLISSCEKDKFSVPVLATLDISEITTTMAKCGGVVGFVSGDTIYQRGICWSTSRNPTISNNLTNNEWGFGSFESYLSELTPNTTYYIRAYATNGTGTGYGNEVVLKTYTGILTDISNHSYYTVTIGDQIWMAENLNTTKYNNGDPIFTTLADVSNYSQPAYQWIYNGDENFARTNGRLYSWFTVIDTRKICPTGWHVPTSADWQTMIDFLGGNATASNKLKATGTDYWLSPNRGATNESGFTALPSGVRSEFLFYNYRFNVCFWLTEEYDDKQAWEYYLGGAPGSLFKMLDKKYFGLSVRCMKD